jgi:ribose 5-phosphate isomerase A
VDPERLKRSAAERAVEFVEDGMVVGLGTGSTVRHVLEVLAERRRAGSLRRICGVPTSKSTQLVAHELGLRLVTLEDEPRIDLTIDGADEVDPALNLIKGMGGALMWEKIVACVSERLLIVADESKMVTRLGQKAPLPVEVLEFGWNTHLAFLDLLGAITTLRLRDDGTHYYTDSGNLIIDCRFEDGIHEPVRLQRELRTRAGILETGLFLGLADTVIVAGAEGVRVTHASPVSS